MKTLGAVLLWCDHFPGNQVCGHVAACMLAFRCVVRASWVCDDFRAAGLWACW